MRADSEKERRYRYHDEDDAYREASRRPYDEDDYRREPPRRSYDEDDYRRDVSRRSYAEEDYRRESPRRSYDEDDYRREPPRRRYDDEEDDREPPRSDRRRERELQKQKKRKKALIISIIALVLVIAIVIGVIFVVNSNTVSAAELQDAKDKYVPPAQAIAIDTSLDDPSNDDIQFTYDDRARILSCTYKANGKPYDQRYTYNDKERRVNIETRYRKRPIFTKDIDYGRVKNPNKFEIVDDYYLRLDDPCLKGNTDATESGASSTATNAPSSTDAPAATEAPTEAPTEEPTEAPAEDYKDLYINFLNDTDPVYRNGKLVYLNDDDVPELILSGIEEGAQVFVYHTCWIVDGKVQYEKMNAKSYHYQERTGYYKMSLNKLMYGGWTRYYFDGSSVSSVQSGSYEVSNNEKHYKVDGEPTDEDGYNAAYGDDDSWSDLSDNVDSSSLPDYIRSFA